MSRKRIIPQKTRMDHGISVCGVSVFLGMLEVMADEVFGFGFLGLTEDVYEKEVFFSFAS